ncbi:hypothetical protein ISCGN_009841 [Ixodes scapularis]
MPVVKSGTRKQYGRRSRFTKARGRNGPKKAATAAASTAAATDDNVLVCQRSSPVRADLAAPAPAPASESASFCDADTLTAFFEAGESGGRDGEDPREPSGDSAAGYRLLDVSCVRSLVEALLCPTCCAGGLQLRETGVGARLAFAVECSTCGVVVSAPLSSTVDGTQQTELAARLGIVSRNCGIGFTKLTNFFTGLNSPPPMHLKTYQKIATKVHDAATRAASNVMKEAARMVRKALGTNPNGEPTPDGEPTLDDKALQDVSVSYDGTWHKRGHTSHFGVGVAIELETGLVLDYAVVSNYCHGCRIGPKEESEGYKEWLEKHQCQKNFDGSANAMEVQAAEVIFSRSVGLHNLQYTTILCDGDSKAYNHVSALQLYDKEVAKEDCVNHVAKRVYAGLEKLKKAKKGLGGRGKLTNVVMKRMTNYYASALKENAPDVTAMQRGVFATLLHMYSTDEDPRHNAYPKGEESWCHHNRHLALQASGKPSSAKPHRPAFSKEVAKEVVPLYNRLAQKELLARCARMKTQNANESFNALVWKRCPKTEFASLQTIETAVALAVLDFNMGPKGMERALLEMEMEAGSHHESQTRRVTQHRLARSQASALGLSKVAHKRRKLEAVAVEQKRLNQEGPTYAPGQF